MSENGKPGRKSDAMEKREHVREQLLVLMATSFCSIPHGPRLPRPSSFSPALAERRKEASVYEGDRDCPECQRKLVAMSAALVLLVLPATPTEKLAQAAKELRAGQPMTWSAILKASPMHLELALKRARQVHFTAAEYQAMASELLAALQPSAAA